jgi:fluoride exporter
MLRVAVVALGGALGAVARYGVSLLVARFWTADFPLGTFLINVSGSFILGFFATLAAERTALDPLWRLLVATGFIGAYTTFSTFEYETQRLTESGATTIAAVNVVGSLVAGFAAVQLGVMLARR